MLFSINHLKQKLYEKSMWQKLQYGIFSIFWVYRMFLFLYFENILFYLVSKRGYCFRYCMFFLYFYFRFSLVIFFTTHIILGLT